MYLLTLIFLYKGGWLVFMVDMCKYNHGCFSNLLACFKFDLWENVHVVQICWHIQKYVIKYVKLSYFDQMSNKKTAVHIVLGR